MAISIGLTLNILLARKLILLNTFHDVETEALVNGILKSFAG